MKRQPAVQTRQPAASTQAAQAVVRKPETVVQRKRQRAGGEAQRPNSHTALTPDELNLMIATAAYRRAEQRGFEPGHELDDWLAAEIEIKDLLANRPAAS
jgi:hypothetical protein